MDSTAVRLIKVTDEISYFTIADARVDYLPAKKYRVEKRNAFDPTYIHRREPYYEDAINIAAIISQVAYAGIHAMLVGPGRLYVEFAWQGTILRQFPVEVTNYPPLSDDLREYKDETKFSLVARYATTPEIIDWDTYSIPEGMENYV